MDTNLLLSYLWLSFRFFTSNYALIVFFLINTSYLSNLCR